MASPPHPISTAEPFFVDTSSLPPESSADFQSITWRTVFGHSTSPTASITQGICTIPRGQTLKRHHHSQPETVYVLSGEALVEAGAFVDQYRRGSADSASTFTPPEMEDVQWSSARRVKAGDAWFLPANCPHKTRNDSEKEDFVVFYTLAADKFEDVVYCYDE